MGLIIGGGHDEVEVGALERGCAGEAFPEMGDEVHHALGAGVEEIHGKLGLVDGEAHELQGRSVHLGDGRRGGWRRWRVTHLTLCSGDVPRCSKPGATRFLECTDDARSPRGIRAL